MREMVSDLLTKHGLTVIQANDGADAKAKIEANRSALPDLVVTDIIMPNMNGYELCRWLKADPQAKSIPVVMVTTKSEDFDRYWAMKQGGDAYLIKPYNPEELITIIKQLLKQ
jgi:twitching motility two-component system response regulator PilH